MNSSRTLSMENMNTSDSSSIRNAMYDTWRAEKTMELKKRKKEEKRKQEEAEKQKKKASTIYLALDHKLYSYSLVLFDLLE